MWPQIAPPAEAALLFATFFSRNEKAYQDSLMESCSLKQMPEEGVDSVLAGITSCSAPASPASLAMTRAAVQANAGASRLPAIESLNLGLEKLLHIGNCLQQCSRLRCLTLSNNRLVSLQGTAQLFSVFP